MSPEIIKKHYTLTQQIIAEVTGILLIIPLSPFICRFVPPVFLGDWNVDLIISILIAAIIIRLILWLIKPMIIPAFILVCGILIYNEFNSTFTLTNIANSYKTLITQNWGIREQKQTDQLSFNPYLFENIGERTSRLVKQKVQFKDSVVRNFSVQHSLEYFDDYHYKYRDLARYFSLFKYINRNFKSLSHFLIDCTDHRMVAM